MNKFAVTTKGIAIDAKSKRKLSFRPTTILGKMHKINESDLP